MGFDRLSGHGQHSAGSSSSLGGKSSGAASVPATTSITRDYGVFRAGDFAIVRLYADGWTDLTPRHRMLAWHLSQAALAGRNIYWDQVHPHGPAVRRLVEGLYRRAAALDATFASSLQNYTRRLWLNNGFYNTRTRQKFVPAFGADTLRRAVAAALAAGAAATDLGVPAGRPLTAHLDDLAPALFDIDHEPRLICKSPGPGGDMLRESAVNFYRGVTLEEVEAWAAAGGETHPLNARVVRRDGHLTEEVWRAGDPAAGVAPGRYAAELARVIAHLEAARGVAEAPQAEALARLIDYYRGGSSAAWHRYNLAWVADRDAEIDSANGFIEVYNDPRSLKGSFEGVVWSQDRPSARIMADLAAAAGHFEATAPWDDAFKRRTLVTPAAAAVNVLMAIGDGGPTCAIGANLPNDQSIREAHGSKSVLLANVLRAYDAAIAESSLDEFALPEERDGARRHAVHARFLQTAMHEVLGHASGAVSPDLAGSPADHLRQHYSALEEARAELVALHGFWDAKLVEIGAITSDEVPRVAYQSYARSGLLILRRVKTGDTLEDDHMRATALIVNFLIARGAIEVVQLDGKTFHRVPDFATMRDGVAMLLREIQRIKATGDFAAAETLIERHATRFDPRVRDEIVRRAADAGLPDFYAAVMPRLEPVLDDDGRMIDVRARHDETFDAQMLRFGVEEAAG